jgi:hypothetical protein
MHFSEIKKHLRPYSIFQKRRTTVNHAFAAAIAPCDDYDEDKLRRAIRALGQDPDQDLLCAYCGGVAQTWDHVLPTVLKSEFSGAGHRVSNLVPCCKPCNSSKGSRNWELFLGTISKNDDELAKKKNSIRLHLSNMPNDKVPTDDCKYRELRRIRDDVLALLKKADVLAQEIRTSQKAR